MAAAISPAGEALRQRLESSRSIAFEIRILRELAVDTVEQLADLDACKDELRALDPEWTSDPEADKHLRATADSFLDALEASAARLSRRRDLLQKIIDSTPPKPREILQLRYLEGRTWAQIAEATGYSSQHVQRLAPAAIDAAAASPLAAAFLEARQNGPGS